MKLRPDWRRRLEKIVEDAGGNRTAISQKAKLNKTYIRDVLERNQRPNPENAQKLSDGLGIQITDWFLDVGAGESLTPTKRGKIEVDADELARIPVYDLRFAAGPGATTDDEEPIDHYLVSLNLLHSLTDAPISMLAIFQVDGDGMEDTIFNRDWVFVDRRKKRLTNPGIYALVFEGDRFLKRASQHLETKEITLVSDNKAYGPQTIQKPDRLQVIGRVFMSIRRH